MIQGQAKPLSCQTVIKNNDLELVIESYLDEAPQRSVTLKV